MRRTPLYTSRSYKSQKQTKPLASEMPNKNKPQQKKLSNREKQNPLSQRKNKQKPSITEKKQTKTLSKRENKQNSHFDETKTKTKTSIPEKKTNPLINHLRAICEANQRQPSGDPLSMLLFFLAKWEDVHLLFRR